MSSKVEHYWIAVHGLRKHKRQWPTGLRRAEFENRSQAGIGK